mgnify:CR=1 FL=1
MSDLLKTLDGAETAVWGLWGTAAGSTGAPGNLAALGTSNQHGGAGVRMLVLRAAGSRKNYLRVSSPETPIGAGEPEPDVANFGVLTMTVSRIDILSLAHVPHRRAVIDASGAQWIVP